MRECKNLVVSIAPAPYPRHYNEEERGRRGINKKNIPATGFFSLVYLTQIDKDIENIEKLLYPYTIYTI